MNKVYRSVWNTTTNTWAAAAETAKSRSKGSARVARTAVAALLLGGASMTGAFAAEVDATEEDEKTSQTVTVSQAASTGTTGSNSIGTQSIGTSAIGTTAALDDRYFKVNATANSATASGDNAVAIGQSVTSDGSSSIAMGSGTTASGLHSTALGASAANASGLERQTAVGGGASTGAYRATAVGALASAQGTSAIALGDSAGASGANAIALGRTASASTGNAIAIGNGAIADNGTIPGTTGSIAIGGGARAGGVDSIAIGTNARHSGSGATVLGGSASAMGGGAGVALGNSSAAGGRSAVAVGANASASGANSVALGTGSVATLDNTVSVGTTAVGGQRRIVNVDAGTQATDAVNLGQMNTALSTKVDNDYVKVNGTVAATSIANGIAIGDGAKSDATGAAYQAIALGRNSSATGNATALGAGTTAVSRGTAVGGGAQATGGYATSIGYLSSASGNNTTALGQGAAATGDNSTALGRGSSTTAANSVAVGYGSVADAADTVSVGTTAVGGQRRIVNVDAGTLSATSTDAVNGSQLYTTNTNVAGLTTRMGTAEGNITTLQQQVGSGTIGLVQQASAGANLTVGKGTDGAAVDFTNNASQQRKLIGVAAGTVSSTSREAINGSQLRGVSDSVASAIGAGSTVNTDGSITAPSFTVGDGSGGTTTVRNVGAAVTNLNDRVTTNEGDITTLQQQVGSGTIGLVQQAGAGGNLTVGKSTDGAAVDFTNNASQQRKLIGVAAGTVSTTSREAINGSQLRGVSDSVASAIGAGSTVNADGSITAPSFTVGDGSGGTTIVHNVGAAVTNLNDRVTTNEGDITNIRNDLSSGSIGLVQQASAGAELTVGKNTDGAVVNFAGTAGDRRLNGVANGTADNDAASIAQLKAMGLFDPNNGRALAAVVYDDIDLKNVTLGGTGGTYLNNVAPGLIASGSMQAVNGSQLFDLDQKLEGYYSSLDGRVGAIEAGGTGGGSGGGKDPGDFSGSGTGSTQLGAGADASGSNSSAIGNGSSASGSGGTAIGQGSSASGDRGTAIGQGSSATHDNSVALGAGSTTDRDGSVSVGSEGNERQITNVRAGTAPTDAVNVQQMNNAVHSARQDAMGGVAAAMAVAGLPQSTLPGRTFMAIAGSTYGNEYGTAIGASYMTKDGKWIVKGAVNTSSRGEVGAVVGGGFYW